jgi:hypothetical protein
VKVRHEKVLSWHKNIIFVFGNVNNPCLTGIKKNFGGQKNARWSKLWTCCLGGGKSDYFSFKTIFKLLKHLSTI